jgi:hypothetical protein
VAGAAQLVDCSRRLPVTSKIRTLSPIPVVNSRSDDSLSGPAARKGSSTRFPPMADPTSPSPILTYFVREMEGGLPDAGKETLATYAAAVSLTTHHGDFRRAWHCAAWAVRLAERSASTHVGHLVDATKETYALYQDTLFGADVGLQSHDGVGPGEDVELQWVDDAVAVAKAEGERAGWDAVPWEHLLVEMLAVAPPKI